MRVIGIVLVWVVGALACAVLAILAYEALGRGAPPSPADLLGALPAYRDALLYAAAAGLVLALLSLIPAVVRQNAERILFWVVFGALSGAFSVGCAVFLYKGFELRRAGMPADAVPLGRLLVGEMQVPAYLPYGAVAGAVLALVMIVASLLRANAAEQAAARFLADAGDPDTMIRARRARRAQRYLAGRRQREVPAANSAEG